MILACLALLTVTAATIHDDRRAAFRRSAQMFPEELEDRIWEYYPEIVYGDNPQSPILSLDETQAYFPILYVQDPSSSWYGVDYISQSDDAVLLPEDRYLPLHVTDDTRDHDTLFLNFIMLSQNCQSVAQYTLKKDGTLYRSEEYEYEHRRDWSLAILVKEELNRDLEHGTTLLLYIPRGCTMALDRVARWFFVLGHDELSLPETVLVSDDVPQVCRQRSWFSQIKRWMEGIIQARLDSFVLN